MMNVDSAGIFVIIRQLSCLLDPAAVPVSSGVEQDPKGEAGLCHINYVYMLEI